MKITIDVPELDLQKLKICMEACGYDSEDEFFRGAILGEVECILEDAILGDDGSLIGSQCQLDEMLHDIAEGKIATDTVNPSSDDADEGGEWNEG
jgi:hypothetical protein